MSDSPDDERLEELREQKKEQLRERAQQNEGEEAAREQAEAQKEALLKKTLTDDARQRLNAVRMSKPEFAQQVEQQIVALARSGRVQGRIDGDRMRELLKKLKPDSTDFNIRRR